MGCGDSCSFAGNTINNENEIQTYEYKRMQQDQALNGASQKDSNQQKPQDDTDLFKDYFYMDSVERYNVKYRPRDPSQQINKVK